MVYLFLSSENAYAGSANNFTVNVNNYLDGIETNVKQFRLLRCMIEGGIFNVGADANVLYYEVNYIPGPTTTDLNVTVPPGNYNINTLAAALQTLMVAAGHLPVGFTVTPNTATGQIVFATNDTDYTMTILGGIAQPLNINEIIGFSSSTDSTTDSTLTSPNIVDLSFCDKILIRSNITQGTVFWDAVDNYSDIVDIIFNTASGFGNIYYEPIRPLLHTTQGMSTMTFRLTDEDNNLLALNGKNWSLILEIIEA